MPESFPGKSDATTTVATFPADTVTHNAVAGLSLAHIRTVKTTGAVASKVIGSLVHHVVATGSTNTANVSANPSEIHSISGFNATSYPVYLKLHNTNGTPTAGAGVVLTVGVQAGQRVELVFPGGLGGQVFTAGIGRSIVKGITDADATAVLAGDCVFDVEYTRNA